MKSQQKALLTSDKAWQLINPTTKEISSQELVTDPLVSVCVITYNHGPYIKKALSGILMQETEFSVEVIIGDDASTDEASEIIDDYQ